MKTLVYVLLFLALAFVASAQMSSNISGVTLTGNLNDPTVENHSGKSILVVRWRWIPVGDARPRDAMRWFSDDAKELPNGASAKIAYKPGKAQIASATITAVFFVDGEFRGEDKDPIRHGTEVTFQLMREVWQLAQAGEWDKVKARADEDDLGIIPQIAAKRLLKARGDEAAMASMAYLGLLPANTWTAGPLVNTIPTVIECS